MLALQAVVVVALAAFLGLGSAWLAVERELAFDSVRAGGWTAFPTAGDANTDPYVRARFATVGELPLDNAEGLAFTARQDTEGRPLFGGCAYRVSGQMPAARAWTVTLYRDADLSLIDNRAERHGFHSLEALRTPDGAVEIAVSPRARPGNWLPSDPEPARLRLVLRLYDTPLATGGRVADIDLPVIEREACE